MNDKKVLPDANSYDDLCAKFHWSIPERFNIAIDVCDRHAEDTSRIAMIYEDELGRISEHTFTEFRDKSNQLANALRRLGIEREDRVAIVMSQRPETGVAHLGIYKLGAIAVPLATLFGPDALEYRLRNAGVRVVITDVTSLDRLLQVRQLYPGLE
ncbi:MAG: AMP-binding protein, partial [Betaproteobacteria bacterium]